MNAGEVNTVLLIIDMQNDGMTMVPTARSVIPVIQRVLAACRAKHIPVIHITREHRADGIDVERFRGDLFQKTPFLVAGTPGVEIVSELKPLSGETVIKKRRFSGFFQTDLPLVLRSLGVEKLVICGAQTPNCIRATAMDAVAYDYDVVLVKDAIAAQTPEIHEANLLDMKNMGIMITTADEFIG